MILVCIQCINTFEANTLAIELCASCQANEILQERIRALTPIATDIFQALDYHNTDNKWNEANVLLAERVALLENHIKVLTK